MIPVRPQPPRQLKPAHARHFHVQQQNVKHAAALAGKQKRLRARENLRRAVRARVLSPRENQRPQLLRLCAFVVADGNPIPHALTRPFLLCWHYDTILAPLQAKNEKIRKAPKDSADNSQTTLTSSK